MICPRRDAPPAPLAASPGSGSDFDAVLSPGGRVYGKTFWLAYTANLITMIATSLLFRYADLVTFLGGSEFDLGWIVGVGMVGGLAVRLALGAAIDQYGTRLIWLGSLAMLALSCFGHLALTTCHGPAIYVLRILFSAAIAGLFGSIMTWISGRVPVSRAAEMIGMLGSAGFVAFVAGSHLGDFLMDSPEITRWHIDRLFLVAGGLILSAMIFASLATRDVRRPPRREKQPSLPRLLRLHNPGMVLIVGVATGVGLSLPGIFLRTFSAHQGIPRIALFFSVYACSALITRICTRRLPERLGLEPMILAGLSLVAVSQLAFLPIHEEWQLVLPAVTYGMAHAVLFPPMIAAGTRYFPAAHRGLATMVMLSTYDIGAIIGAPASGAILYYAPRAGLPSYPTLFVILATFFFAMAAVHAASWRRAPRHLEVPFVALPLPKKTPTAAEPAAHCLSECEGPSPGMKP